MNSAKLLALTAISGCILTAPDAWAADENGLFAVRGIGGQNCQSWVELSETPDETLRREGVLTLQSWLAGYVSAANRQTAETYDAIPFLDMINVLAIVLNECRARPDDLAETTVARVIGAFGPSRVTLESPIVTVPDAGAEKSYRQATVALVQQKLVDQGFLQGEPDGVIGSGTAEALRNYQAAKGLPETGEMSVDTVFNILLQQDQPQ